MNVESKIYETWDTYKQAHPEVKEIETAELLGDYEEEIYRFVFNLFV